MENRIFKSICLLEKPELAVKSQGQMTFRKALCEVTKKEISLKKDKKASTTIIYDFLIMEIKRPMTTYL